MFLFNFTNKLLRQQYGLFKINVYLFKNVRPDDSSRIFIFKSDYSLKYFAYNFYEIIFDTLNVRPSM